MADEKIDGRKNRSKGRTWGVFIRVNPSIKSVVQDAMKASGEPTISAFVRRAVMEYTKRLVPAAPIEGGKVVDLPVDKPREKPEPAVREIRMVPMQF